jgi:hypothetical protein
MNFNDQTDTFDNDTVPMNDRDTVLKGIEAKPTTIQSH